MITEKSDCNAAEDSEAIKIPWCDPRPRWRQSRMQCDYCLDRFGISRLKLIWKNKDLCKK